MSLALKLRTQSMVGEFRKGRSEFYDQELWKGRAVYVRFVWSDITLNSAHFEHSYSQDGGKTWEVNWITDQTRADGPSPWNPPRSKRIRLAVMPGSLSEFAPTKFCYPPSLIPRM